MVIVQASTYFVINTNNTFDELDRAKSIQIWILKMHQPQKMPQAKNKSKAYVRLNNLIGQLFKELGNNDLHDAKYSIVLLGRVICASVNKIPLCLSIEHAMTASF